MPTVTSTPVQISITVPQYRQAGGTNFGELNPFCFKVGSNLFQLLAAVQTENRIGMFSRAVSNAGGAWATQPDGLDSANSPGIGLQSGKLNVFNDSANSGKIAVLYLETDLTSLRIVEFDTVALTWGTPTAALTVSNVSAKFGFTRRSDGTYVVIGTSTGHLYRVLNIGGVWGAITNILNSTVGVVAGGLIDSSDNSYVLLNESGTAMSLRHLDSTNTLSSAVQITTTLAGPNSAGPPTLSLFGATGIAVGWVTTAGLAPALVSIAPIATAPVFTNYTIYTPGGPFLNEFVSFVTVVTGTSGALNVFLADVDFDQPINQILQSTFDGVNTWSATTVFYSAISNPPPNGAVVTNQQLVHTLNPIQLTAGWVTPTAMETVNSAGPPSLWCTGFFIEQVASTGTLTLVKSVSSGPVSPSAWNLSAVGPATLSGPGPSVTGSVPTGTYALSESAVPGFISRLGFVCTGGTQVGQNITIAANDVVVCTIINDPVSIPAGGRAFVHFNLNFFNACLGREYLLYKLINRELLKCGIKPACFCIDERDWGGNFSEHEEVPMGPPEGAIAFNPTGQIVMPTMASGDNTVLQFRVPIGYDGVILGQYHQYIQPLTAFPPPIFVEGSGDLVWRLEVAGRFVRDCGSMLVSLGSLQNMSPVAGGLQVRSGNIIRYVVAAPNVTGAMMAGVGNIVAGLHGYWWPRH